MRLVDPCAGADWSRGVRGNLHCHSKRSDGSAEPQAVIDAYADAGYGFLMLSDHDVTTPRADLERWDPRGMRLIPGCEISAEGPHLLAVGVDTAVAPEEDRQRSIDAVLAAGGVAVMNHPNWYAEFDHCPQEKLVALDRYHGIEIYNAVINGMEGSSYALDRWDRLLTRGRRVWGFANDDAHHLREVGQGWNVVFPEHDDAAGVVAALRAGRFYASTGVAIERIAVDGPRVTIVAPEAERIVAVVDSGRRLAVADAGELTVTIREKFDHHKRPSYVRFECWGRRERFAWSQPIFVED